jgi:hypothetical protein
MWTLMFALALVLPMVFGIMLVWLVLTDEDDRKDP